MSTRLDMIKATQPIRRIMWTSNWVRYEGLPLKSTIFTSSFIFNTADNVRLKTE